MKKIFAGILIGFFGFLTLIYFFNTTWLPDFSLPYELNKPCAFCDREQIKHQIIYENDLILVILNYKPLAQGHILIFPKRDVERFEDVTPEEMVAMLNAVKKMELVFDKAYGKKDYVLLLQNGYHGGQTVPHTHLHMIPRGDESTLMKKAQLWNELLTESLEGRQALSKEELQEQINELRKFL